MDRILRVWTVILLLCFPALAFDRIDVTVTPRRPEPGDRVVVRIAAPEGGGEVRAFLLRPSSGRTALELKPAATPAPAATTSASGKRTFEASLTLGAADPEGLYAVHVWTGDEKSPQGIGKGWFLRGRLIADYPILSLVDPKRPEADIRAYLEDFHSLGGNFLVVHVLMDPQQAYYPSEIARNKVLRGSPSDYVETFLRHADRLGFPCLLSVSWDMTHNTDYATAPAEIRAVAAELWALYGRHASLAGFYSYQEGSGTYLVPYLREFCGHIKALHPNLLTACAPYVDDPLLSGYLSMLAPLDMVVFQGMTMASFRPDNVKRYPLRRVRDLCGVGIGGKWLQDKIAITHTELFGYLENRVSDKHTTTGYGNILGQVLSAATAAGSDGVSFFTYHANVHAAGRKPSQDIRRARRAVVDGLAAYDLIRDKAARGPNPVAFYYPYEDWVVERWANSYVPALDAFRVLGVAADFVPFAPAARESVYPFYPTSRTSSPSPVSSRPGPCSCCPTSRASTRRTASSSRSSSSAAGPSSRSARSCPWATPTTGTGLLGATEATEGPPPGDRREKREGRARPGRGPVRAAGRSILGGLESGFGLGRGRVRGRDGGRLHEPRRRGPDRLVRAGRGDGRQGHSPRSSATSSTPRWPSRAPGARSTSWGRRRTSTWPHASSRAGSGPPSSITATPRSTSSSCRSARDWEPGPGRTSSRAGEKPGRPADGALAVSVPARGYVCWEYRSD